MLVEFRLVVFRPFKGEVIEGKILDVSPTGIRSTLLPPHQLNDNHVSMLRCTNIYKFISNLRMTSRYLAL